MEKGNEKEFQRGETNNSTNQPLYQSAMHIVYPLAFAGKHTHTIIIIEVSDARQDFFVLLPA